MEDPLPFPLVLVIIPLLLGSGFCSLMEEALRSSRKSWLRIKAEGGEKKYREALKAVEDPASLLASLRIWIIFLSICAGLAGGIGLARPLGARLGLRFAPWGDYLAALITGGALTGTALLLGDTLPRIVFPSVPEELAAAALPLVKVLALPWKPLLALSLKFSGLILKILRRSAAPPPMTEDEFRLALAEGEKSGVVERAMVENLFYLGDRPVGTFMSHRSGVRWLDSNAGPEEVREIALARGEQRQFPVAEGSLDKIIGVVSTVDILAALLEGPWPGLKAIMRPPQFVPETMSALRAFEAFRRGEANLILVMDEYGGFAGVLSVRNLIEEIVGQLSVTAPEEEAIIRREDGSYLADGSVNIDEIARLLPLESLASEHQEYHTLAGFILDQAGEIPRTGADFDYRGYRFTVVDMDGNRIDKVLITPLPPPTEGEK